MSKLTGRSPTIQMSKATSYAHSPTLQMSKATSYARSPTTKTNPISPMAHLFNLEVKKIETEAVGIDLENS